MQRLWQLCFDKQIAEDVYNDKVIRKELRRIIKKRISYLIFFSTKKELYDFIKNLSKDTTNDKLVVKNSTGILWLINQKLSLVDSDLKDKQDQSEYLKIIPTPNIIPDIALQRTKMVKPDASKHIMISYNRFE